MEGPDNSHDNPPDPSADPEDALDAPPSYDTSQADYSGISSVKSESLQTLQEARDFAEMIVDTIREGLLVLDLDLRIQAANESFYDSFGVEPEQTLGRQVYELGDNQWDIPELRELLEDILPENKTNIN